MRLSSLRLAIYLAMVGVATLAATGTAAAFEPVLTPDQGRIGVVLNPQETSAVASGPIPAVVNMIVPANRIGASLHPGTDLPQDAAGVHASLRQVVSESASHGGTVSVLLNAPGSHEGRVFDLYQNWN